MEDSERINERTSKTVMTLTVLHPTELSPNRMTDTDVANHLAMGSFVGIRTTVSTEDISDDSLGRELDALGVRPDHFRREPRLFGDNDE